MKKIHALFTVKAEEPKAESRTISFIGTNDVKDRADEILTLDGWQIDNFMKNPVFLWAHKYDEPPVGKAVSISMVPEGMKFDIEFADKETYPFADTIFRLYKGGFLKAVSVGYREMERVTDQEDNVRVTKKELYELSAVPVPCNPTALQAGLSEAVTKGIINEQELGEMSQRFAKFNGKTEPIVPPPAEKTEEVKALEAKLVDAEAKIAALEAEILELKAIESAELAAAQETVRSIYDVMLKKPSESAGTPQGLKDEIDKFLKQGVRT